MRRAKGRGKPTCSDEEGAGELVSPHALVGGKVVSLHALVSLSLHEESSQFKERDKIKLQQDRFI